MGGFTKKTIRDIDVNNKRILLRADYNVPLGKDGQIQDDYRITKSIPTLHYLLEKGCKVVVMSHLGRPKGVAVPSMSLAPVAIRLKKLLHGVDVIFADDCVGENVTKAVKALKPGQVLLLENTRFHAGDEANDPDFALALSKHGEIFVSDAFGVVHRAHASTTGVAEHLPSVAGLLLEQEMTIIGNAMENPDRPLMAIIGGAKIADKIVALNRLVDTADAVAVVGAMANVFFLARGLDVGSSLVNEAEVPLAQEIIKKAQERSKNGRFTFLLPVDAVVSTSIDGTKPTRIVDLSDNTLSDIQAYPLAPKANASTVAEDELILDIGPISAARIAGVASQMNTLVWSGTAGVAEVKGINGSAKPFEHGTRKIVAELAAPNAPFTIVGGGDTVSYVESISGLREKLGHVSTGGSTSMEVISGNKMVGVEALLNKEG